MAIKSKSNLPATQTERQEAIVPSSNSLFADYTAERERWLTTKLAHNETLAESGAVFSIIAAIEGTMPASEIDVRKNDQLKLGDDIPKIKYLCVAQMDFDHEDPLEEKNDVHYEKGEQFLILFTPSAIRRADLARIQEFLMDAPIRNVCLQQVPMRKPGMNPVITMVSAEQWKPLRNARES